MAARASMATPEDRPPLLGLDGRAEVRVPAGGARLRLGAAHGALGDLGFLHGHDMSLG